MLNLFACRCAGFRRALLLMVAAAAPAVLHAQQLQSPSIIHKVQSSNDRLQMTVNTSRILTLDQNIPRVQVNNPDLLDLTPLSANQIQIHAKKVGVTQVNLWNSKQEILSIDVVIDGDARSLADLLRAQFPSASIRVYPTANGVILQGYVDRADHVPTMVQMARDYYPNVIDNITVGGVQQVLLHVKVAEVSRTKLRQFGFDFANISGGGQDFVTSSISGLLTGLTSTNGVATGIAANASSTMTFGIVDPSNSFFGVLQALQRNQLMKLLAEPTLVTVSGRPAYFQSGGEVPVMIPQGLGTVAVEYRRFGTQVDFVPIVLGNGLIRLEVRPRVSEIDNSISVTFAGNTVPGFRTREVETGVELRAGQTLALAGLIQNRVETEKTGVPWLSDMPYIGMPFRRVRDLNNEIELLILVRPELAGPLDCGDVPPCGPGERTRTPSNCDLYIKGYSEVPGDFYPKNRHPMGGFNGEAGGGGYNPGEGPMTTIGPNGAPVETVPPGETIIEDQQLPPAQPVQPSPDSVRVKPLQRPIENRFALSDKSGPQNSSSVPPADADPSTVQTAPKSNETYMKFPSATARMNPASTSSNSSSRRTAPQIFATRPQPTEPPAVTIPTNPSVPANPQPVRSSDMDFSGPGLIGPSGYDVSK